MLNRTLVLIGAIWLTHASAFAQSLGDGNNQCNYALGGELLVNVVVKVANFAAITGIVFTTASTPACPNFVLGKNPFVNSGGKVTTRLAVIESINFNPVSNGIGMIYPYPSWWIYQLGHGGPSYQCNPDIAPLYTFMPLSGDTMVLDVQGGTLTFGGTTITLNCTPYSY